MAAEAAHRKQVGGRGAEEDDQRLGEQARLQPDDESIRDDRVRELVEQFPGRGVDEDPDDREQQEGERQRRNRSEEANADRSLHRRELAYFFAVCFTRGRKPNFSSFFWPALLKTRLMNARASGLSPLVE